MASHKFINNFTAGEFTPLLDGRSDLEKYDSACRRLENFRVMPYGGARFRTGFGHVVAAKDGATRKTRLIPFQFSVSTRFILQFSEFAIRFITNGVQVESSPGVAYEIATPYVEADLFAIQFKQINDVMYLVHPSYAPRKLSRLADTSWTLVEVPWTWPALMEENTTNTTLTVSNAAVGTGRTMTASASLFVSAHVGSYWEVRHLRQASSVVHPINGTVAATVTTSAELTVKGEWTVTTNNYWYGTLEVQRSENAGATWETIRMFKGESDRNVSASGTQVKEARLRLRYTVTGDPFGSGVWAGSAPTNYVRAKATLETQEIYVAGLVRVTNYTSSTLVTVDVVNALAATSATNVWSEGAWSAKRGYPRAIGLFEQRLYFGGTASNPIRFWGSQVGDFDNFEYGDTDDAAVAFDMASTESNVIQWIEALEVIQVGTAGGEFMAGSGNRDEPITPSNISVKGQSAYGSDSIQAIPVNDAVLFVQRQGRRVREMAFDLQRGLNGKYASPELTLLAEHVTQSGIVQVAFARQPDPLLLAVTGDGNLAVLTYNREQNITAWARWQTDGVIESVASIYGTPEDEIWLVVRRQLPSGTVRNVEKLSSENSGQYGRNSGQYGRPTNDVLFVIDTTGSMGGIINAVKAKVAELAALFLANSTGVRFALRTFKDESDPFVFVDFTDIGSFTAALDGITAAGGGDAPENGFGAIVDCVSAASWDPRARRFMVLFTDNESHERGATKAAALAALHAEQVTFCYALGYISSYDLFRTETGGVRVDDIQNLIGQLSPVILKPLREFYLDAAVVGTTTNGTTASLSHLEGREVTLVWNGSPAGTHIVDGGSIPLPGEIGNYVVGLPYVGTLMPMKMEVGLQNGPSQGRKRRVVEVSIRFHETGGARYGRDEAQLDLVEFRKPDDLMDAAIPLFTGDKVVSWPPGYDRSANIIIRQQEPLPCTVLGLAVKFDVFGE